MAIISGSYSGYFNHPIYDDLGSFALGNTRTGFRHSHSFGSREINFDSLGSAPADILFTGWQVYVDFVLQEYDAAAVEYLHWLSTSRTELVPTAGKPLGTTDQAGGSLWDKARSLDLQACGTTLPCRRFYPKAILAPNFSIDLDFTHTERAVPIRMLILPVAQPADVMDNLGDLEDPDRPIGCERVLYWLDLGCYVPPEVPEPPPP